MARRNVRPVSPEVRERLQRSAAQLAAYTTFLRWAAGFSQDEMQRHQRHDQVVQLSVVQSSRFAFAIEGETLYWGVQETEAAWVSWMPFDAAYVSDRLYLAVNSAAVFNSKIPSLAIGIYVDGADKRAAMGLARRVQPYAMTVREGVVTHVGGDMGRAIPMERGDVVPALHAAAKARTTQRDLSRFL